jgi:hypothetical protein
MRSIHDESRGHAALVLGTCSLIAALAVGSPATTRADSVGKVESESTGIAPPRSAGTMPPKAEKNDHLIWAARVCYLEATWRESDCIALLYVAQKRAARVDRPWLDVLSDYSTVHAKNARAVEVRAFPWADVPGKSAVFNRRWERLRALVVEFASGQHADPCPRAEHWGGTMDRPRGNMIKARCAASTVNTFYAVRAVRK